MMLYIDKQDGLGVWCNDNLANGRHRNKRLSWTEYNAAMNEPVATEHSPQPEAQKTEKQPTKRGRW